MEANRFLLFPEAQEARWLLRWARTLEIAARGSKSHLAAQAFSLAAESIEKASKKRPSPPLQSAASMISECAARQKALESPMPLFPEMSEVVSAIETFVSSSDLPESARIADDILCHLGASEAARVTTCVQKAKAMTESEVRVAFSLVVKAAAWSGTRSAIVGDKAGFLSCFATTLGISPLGRELAILGAAVSVHDDDPLALLLVHQRLGVVSSLIERQTGPLPLEDLAQMFDTCTALRRALCRQFERSIETDGSCDQILVALLRSVADLEDTACEGLEGSRELSLNIDLLLSGVAQGAACRLFESTLRRSAIDDPAERLSRAVSSLIALLARARNGLPSIRATLSRELFYLVWHFLSDSGGSMASKATVKSVQDLCECLSTFSKLTWDLTEAEKTPTSCDRLPSESPGELFKLLEPFFVSLESMLGSEIPVWTSRAIAGDPWKPKGDLKVSISVVDVFDMASEPLKVISSSREVVLRLHEAICRPISKAMIAYAQALQDSIGEGLAAIDVDAVRGQIGKDEKPKSVPGSPLLPHCYVKANNLDAMMRWLDGLITSVGCGKDRSVVSELEVAFKRIGRSLDDIVSFASTWCSAGARKQLIKVTKHPKEVDRHFECAVKYLDEQLAVAFENLNEKVFNTVLRSVWRQITSSMARAIRGKTAARRSLEVVKRIQDYFRAGGLSEGTLENESLATIRSEAGGE